MVLTRFDEELTKAEASKRIDALKAHDADRHRYRKNARRNLGCNLPEESDPRMVKLNYIGPEVGECGSGTRALSQDDLRIRLSDAEIRAVLKPDCRSGRRKQRGPRKNAETFRNAAQ